VPRTCPICKGGDHQDTHSFALNLTEGVYVCKRGKCGARGRFSELSALLGEDGSITADAITARKLKKHYTIPALALGQPTQEIIDYFGMRKISKGTVEAFGIKADGNGNIVFPFERDGVLTYVKFRKPHKPAKGEPKEWQSKGACPILYGMDMCAYNQPLIITEGQIDAMSLYECGVTNVVSVPSGCENLEWIETCWDWLSRFKSIILFGDNDAPGQRMVQTIIRRLDEARCMVIEDYPCRENGTPCKDPNEILYFLGTDALLDTLHAAKPVPIRGIISLADVVPLDPTTLPRIRTMIPSLDEALGGLIEGGMTVLSGKPGDGKSTVAGLFLLNAIEQGHSVCAYSGELTKERYQEWTNLQLAGSKYIGLKYDPVKRKQVPYLSYPVQQRLLEYYKDRYFLFDNHSIMEANQSEAILQVFTATVRRYGCKLFLVDNLMTALSDSDEELRAQGRLANMLKRFANQYGVHVLLVAHPRKTRFGEALRQDDIGGNSATIRLADSAVVVERPNLRIIKNREGGLQRVIECAYCPDSRRIYELAHGDKNNFKWNKDGLELPQMRADSLPEYGITFAEVSTPF